MDRIHETAKRAVRAHFLTTGDPKKHGHPRDGLGGELIRRGYDQGTAAAVHTKAAEHLMTHHGMSHEQVLHHLNGEKGRELAHRLAGHSGADAVKHVGAHLDHQLGKG